MRFLMKKENETLEHTKRNVFLHNSKKKHLDTFNKDKKQKDAKDIEKHLEHNSKKKHLDTFNKIRKLHAIVENLTL
jgi:F0F1-type ATP synthase alpha subunit